jgi:hypothetical protein
MSDRKAVRLKRLIDRPRTFVARLILADLIAKRGEGPLERKAVAYGRRRG